MPLNVKSATDIYMTYRFIRSLVTPFNKTRAYELGIIDADGNPLKKRRELQSTEEKNAYTVYDRLVFKLKRLLGKIPGGQSRLASYASALWLIKEHVCGGDRDKLRLIENEVEDHIDDVIFESKEKRLCPGRYVVVSESVGDVFDEVRIGDIVSISEFKHTDTILGIRLYKATHEKSSKEMVISYEEVQRIY